LLHKFERLESNTQNKRYIGAVDRRMKKVQTKEDNHLS
jgi:hypothetical protein